jgi:anaerobic ribonucleoside-triphosphate reductase activating protein
MRYIDITYPDVNNGAGCRVTLWVAGCKHNCKGCHNPKTHDYKAGELFTEETYKELSEILSKPYISGLTLSGGDPLCQQPITLAEIENLVKRVKQDFPDKTIWIYTGYYREYLKGIQLDILKYCDVLVDGPYVEELRDITLPFRGSSNQKIHKLH